MADFRGLNVGSAPSGGGGVAPEAAAAATPPPAGETEGSEVPGRTSSQEEVVGTGALLRGQGGWVV